MSTGYRPPSREPRGEWAQHIHAFRKEHGWSASHAFEEWHEGLGLSPRSRSAYLAIDIGDRLPNAREADYLISQIGEPSEIAPEPLERPDTPDSLVAALHAQTQAISELVTYLRETRDFDVRLAAVEAAIALRALPNAGGSPKRGSPPVGAER